MGRSSVTMRPATTHDVMRLAEIWHGVVRPAEREEQICDLEVIVRTAADSPQQRLLVADVGGEAVAAVLLRVTTMTPINLEQAVQAISPHVLPGYRRHGIGTMMMEQAVSFADEVGVAQIATGAESASREANRFMARLGLSPRATMRVGSTMAVRSRLEAERQSHRPTAGSGRQLSRVLAVRRSQRRSREVS